MREILTRAGGAAAGVAAVHYWMAKPSAWEYLAGGLVGYGVGSVVDMVVAKAMATPNTSNTGAQQ